MTVARKPNLVLNVAPVRLTQRQLQIGRIPWENEDVYRKLRNDNWRTHAFRFDQRTSEILNVAIKRGMVPLGRVEDVLVEEHLLLVAQGIQQSVLVWIADSVSVLKKNNKRLLFLGRAEDALLLTRAVEQAGLTSVEGLEVSLRYEIDCRMFFDREDKPFLGLVINVDSANTIDLTIADLLQYRFPVIGRYVSRLREDTPPYLRPGLELAGRVVGVEGDYLLLADTDEEAEIRSDEAYLEPRQENLEAVVEAIYRAKTRDILTSLRQFRQPVSSANGKLAIINTTLDALRQRGITIANGLRVELDAILSDQDAVFPDQIITQRPRLLFGAQGHNGDQYPDAGIRTFGPYMYMHHTRNAPLIAVVCEARHRGKVEQFLNLLCNGFPDELWRGNAENPYRGGLIGKFRIGRIEIEIEEVAGRTSEDYRSASQRLLRRLPETPDLAFVQTRESFRRLQGNDNPYFAAKSEFMTAGVPMQAVYLEKIEYGPYQLPYLLNTVALACYAKLDGTPWVISTKATTTHELILGIGSAEVAMGRLGGRERYIGITTIFQGDGRYLLSNQTREVTADDYAAELLTSLRTALRHVRVQNAWEAGDRVRLVCHVFKRLRDAEVETIKTLVRDLLSESYSVEFAFIDISPFHPYHLFAPRQNGVQYTDLVSRQKRLKGIGVPDRGVCLQLDRRRVLLHLTGPTDVKTSEQGLPQPLLIELHPDSDFTDLAYLARQAYHLVYASWKSFTPATEPVTILYAHFIASLLGNLRPIQGWNSTALTVGGLRGRCWFI